MAQTTKKKTQTKTSASKKNTKGKSKKKSGQMTLSDVIFRQEFKATVIFVFGLLLAVVMLFAGGDGSFWNKIHLFYFAVTGLCGYYIPLAVLFFGVVNVMNRQNNTYYFKAAELFVLLLIVCGLVHINTVADEAVTYGDAIKNVYNAVMDQKSSAVSNGGVFGAVCGGALFAISKSKIVADIISVMLLIADLMLLFGITLFRLRWKSPRRRVPPSRERSLKNAARNMNASKRNAASGRIPTWIPPPSSATFIRITRRPRGMRPL